MTYIDKGQIVSQLGDFMEELRSFREDFEHQSESEIYLRCMIRSVKQMIDKKTYSLDNIRYISARVLDFLESIEDNDTESVESASIDSEEAEVE